jgi:hypothetical protein
MFNGPGANPFSLVNQTNNRVSSGVLIHPMTQTFILGLHLPMNIRSHFNMRSNVTKIIWFILFYFVLFVFRFCFISPSVSLKHVRIQPLHCSISFNLHIVFKKKKLSVIGFKMFSLSHMYTVTWKVFIRNFNPFFLVPMSATSLSLCKIYLREVSSVAVFVLRHCDQPLPSSKTVMQLLQ